MKNRGAFAEFLMEQLNDYDSDSSVTESEREDLRQQLAETFAPLQGLARTSMKHKGSKKSTRFYLHIFIKMRVCMLVLNWLLKKLC